MSQKKGVFIAATGQNQGKTTTSLAILKKFFPEVPKLSFMKPVGQRTIEVQGEVADEDVILMKKVFDIHKNAKTMSPVTVPAGFTKNYLDGKTDNQKIKSAILDGWSDLTKEGGPVIVEGTGHAGVGSVFDMNNAQVAKLLGLPVIMVAQGGIGRPLDEIALNLALFEKENVSVVGIIFNKSQAGKMEQVDEYCSKYLEKRNIKVLGVVEHNNVLSRPSLERLRVDLKAEVLSGHENLNRVPTKIMAGAGAIDYILNKTVKNTLVVTPASRSDVIIAAAHNYSLWKSAEYESKHEFTGIVLTGNQNPHPDVLSNAKLSGIPILRTDLDVYETIEKIDHSLGKTLATDQEKLDIIGRIYSKALHWDEIGKYIY